MEKPCLGSKRLGNWDGGKGKAALAGGFPSVSAAGVGGNDVVLIGNAGEPRQARKTMAAILVKEAAYE